MLKHDSPINFFLSYVANFFFSAAYFMLFPILPSFAHSLKAGVLGVLPVTITYFLATIITAPIIGYFVDWKGRHRFAIAGAVANVLLAFSYTLVHSIGLFILIRILHGFAAAAFSVAMLTILTDATENSWRADVVSGYLIPQLFWIAIGPAFALFLFPFGGAKTVFLVAAVLSLFGVVFTLFIKRPRIFALGKKEFNIADYLSFDSLLVMASMFIFNAVYSVLLLNVNTYLVKTPGDTLAGFYAWFVIAGLLIMYNVGGLSDRIGRGQAVFVGFVFLIISLIMILFANVKSTATLAGIFFGVSYGLMSPSLIVWWMDIVPVAKRGISMGIMQSIQAIGMIVGLWILNIFAFIGEKGVFVAALTVVLIVFSSLAYHLWPKFKARWS